MPERTPDARRLSISIALALAAAILYARLLDAQFIHFDDPQYVSVNPMVLAGLTWKSIAWAFTSFHSSNWHPLTWISHMLDVQVWGAWAGGHHLTNIVLHAANAVLLFHFLDRATSALWKSAIVAALFALHPLRVESVAWVAERKDVLSTLFWLLAMLAYLDYAATPGVKRYLWVALWMTLGLLSKPMVVTLPVVLFLLDDWPLGRLTSRRAAVRLAIEKLPLLALSAASSVVTIIAQQIALRTFEEAPALMRPANAIVSCVKYIAKMFWPTNLAVMYPYPDRLAMWWVALCAAILLAITIGVLLSRRGYLRTGWFWYLVTLVPVIGIIQVGRQSMADRYTYVPQIGLAIAIVWGADEMLARLGTGPWMRGRWIIATVLSAIVLVACTAVTWVQVGYWHDSITLYQHTLAITDRNFTIHHSLANALIYQNDLRGALRELSMALEIKPNYPQALETRIGIRMKLGDYAGARDDALRGIQILPGPRFEYLAGVASLGVCDSDGAIEHLSTIVNEKDLPPETFFLLAQALTDRHRYPEAVAMFQRAMQAVPDADTMMELAWIEATHPDRTIRKPADAVALAERAQEATGGRDPLVLDTLAAAYAATGDFERAKTTADLAIAAENEKLSTQQVHDMEDHTRIIHAGREINQLPLPRRPVCQRP